MSLTADPLITCPFDRAHQILKSRMQTHLVKCQENHISEEFVTCLFNANHRIRKAELLHHLQCECPDQNIIVRDIAKIGDSTPLTSSYIEPEIPPSEEDWDSCNAMTYDPTQKVTSEPILRNKCVASKAQRKAFHLQERERFNAYQNPPVSAASVSIPQIHSASTNSVAGRGVRKEKPRRQEIPPEVEEMASLQGYGGSGRGIRASSESTRPGRVFNMSDLKGALPPKN